MTHFSARSTGSASASPAPSASAPAEPESLAELRGDCALMADRWPRVAAGSTADPTASAAGTPPSSAPTTGVTVPAGSARLVEGLSEYGD